MERRAAKEPHLSPEHRVWRKAVFQKDDYTCQSCGARSRAGDPVYLHAHHVRRVADEPLAPSTSTTVKHFVSIVIARFTGVWTERDGAGGSAPVRNRLRHIEP